MASTVQSTLKAVATVLNDLDGTRWPASELADWINAAEREIMVYRPDAFYKAAALTLVAGTRQALPADGAKLMSVYRNTTGGSVIRQCSRKKLDAQVPGWHGATPSAKVQHWMYDPREPRSFWVYPPATTSAQIDIEYAARPAAIPTPTGDAYTTASGSLGVAEDFTNAVIDYVLYRAFMKDSDDAAAASRSTLHYSAFASAVGIEIQATQAAATPAPSPNPTIPADNA